MRSLAASATLALASLAATGCGAAAGAAGGPAAPGCNLVASGYGPAGAVPIRVERVATGLEVPWGLAFLPGGDLLVTERPGRIRLVRGGRLEPAPVATVAVATGGEGGLLGIAVDPGFAQNHRFYTYATVQQGGRFVNRIARWILAADRASAREDAVLLDGIPAAQLHDGGRLRFGPDGMIYASTGDAGRQRLPRRRDPGVEGLVPRGDARLAPPPPRRPRAGR